MSSTSTYKLRNTAAHELRVVAEPWGHELALAPEAELDLMLEADAPGQLEIDYAEDGITIWAWPTCTLRLEEQGGNVVELSIPVQEVPTHQTVSSFLGAVLGTDSRAKDAR